MTEYDYSPEAYERYTRTQQRIAEWVDRTEEHRPHFGSAEAQRQRGPAPFLQSASKGLQSMFRRRRRSSSSHSSDSSSSDIYSNTPRSPGPMQPLRPVNLQQPTAQYQQQPRAHKHSSHRPSHSHTSYRSPTYIVTTPPATAPAYAYVYANAQGTPGVVVVPPKGSVATSPPTSYYQPSASAPGYPFPQNAYPQTAPAAGSFIYASQAQTQAQTRPPTQQIYSQATVPQVQPQTQYAQTTYPPIIYPLTPYTAYPQQAQTAAQPQIIYEMSSRKKHRRSESSRRSH